MKYADEFRDPVKAKALLAAIKDTVARISFKVLYGSGSAFTRIRLLERVADPQFCLRCHPPAGIRDDHRCVRDLHRIADESLCL